MNSLVVATSDLKTLGGPVTTVAMSCLGWSVVEGGFGRSVAHPLRSEQLPLAPGSATPATRSEQVAHGPTNPRSTVHSRSTTLSPLAPRLPLFSLIHPSASIPPQPLPTLDVLNLPCIAHQSSCHTAQPGPTPLSLHMQNIADIMPMPLPQPNPAILHHR